MNVEQLLPLVQKAHAEGKKYLPSPHNFINVDEVRKWKASYEQKLQEASRRLDLYRTNPHFYGVVSGLILIRSIVGSAAHDFCIYLRDLGILRQPADWPPLPKELKAYPKFQEYWNACFEDTRAQLYSDPD